MRRPFYHLTREDRDFILEGIILGNTLADIADALGKHPTSVSREVKKYRSSEGRRVFNRKNICAHAKVCTVTKLCRDTCRKSSCARCMTRHCFDICPDFVEEVCSRTSRWPYVCNGCFEKRGCVLPRYLYRPSVAQARAGKVKTESRSALSVSKEQLAEIDALISPLLKVNKQSIEVICANNPQAIPVSAQTLRRYLEAGHTSAIRLDLLSAPSRKVRRKKKARITRHAQDNRSFADFTSLSEEVKDFAWEIDTVHGRAGDKSCLLTLISRASLFMFVLKIAACDSECVVGALDYLEMLCDEANIDFADVFEVILADNGSEFSDLEGMETSCLSKVKRTSLYFCDPYSSWQKPHVEGRHRLIRRVLPKGTSLDKVTHDKISLLASHINSYPILSKAGAVPIEIASCFMPSTLFEGCGIEYIDVNDVALTRNLFDS